jgi:predicted ATPase/DNA-binding SARP family transcriptional activator/tetratricopeptide (TPR) repeat protein
LPPAPLDVEFRVLGPLEAWIRREPVPLGGHKPRTVLAVLLLDVNQVVSTDRLIDVLWGERPPPAAGSTLRGYVSRLRSSMQRALGDAAEPLIVSRPPGYVLSLPADCIDSTMFEALVSTGEANLRDHPGDASRSLRAALDLWRGPAYVEFLYDGFAEYEIARLHELRLVALGDRIDADLIVGDRTGVVAELQSLTRQYPVREQFHARLMRALTAEGRPAEALRVYENAVAILADEAGVEPGPELRLLAVSLRDPQAEAGSDTAPPATTAYDIARLPAELAAPAARLPSVLTSFVGRQREVAAVVAMLERHRLVTITGTGGSGKTRLALEVAADAALRPGRRVLFVGVADTRPGSLPGAIAAALGVRFEGDRPALEVLAGALDAPGTLFVLDNCEHLIAEAAGLVAALISRCPGLVVLATSRQRLAVSGEQVWRIPPLSLPDPDSRSLGAALQSDAVRLFAERAATVRADVPLGDEDTAAIVLICRRLDGLPLAIELAAARLTILSPTEVADRLDDSLRMLRGGPRDSSDRHRALQATLDWSYRMLPSAEQQLLRRLSVFCGSFTLDAVSAVCGWGELGQERLLDVLDELVDKSLVVPSVRAATSHFRLLEIIRQYAADLALDAGESEAMAARHAAHLTTRFAATSPLLRGPQAPAALDWLDGHADDLHAALIWLGGQADGAGLLQLAGAAWPYWDYRFLVTEGRQWLRLALAAPEAPTPQAATRERRMVALAGAAKLARIDDDRAEAALACREGLALAGELGRNQSRAPFLVVLGDMARDDGDEAAVHEYCEEAVTLSTAAGDPSGAGDAMRVMALQATDSGKLADAEQWGERCIELWDRGGDSERSAGIRTLLGGVAMERGHFDEAQRLFEESLRRFHQAREPKGTANAICSLAALANLQRQALRAVSLGEDSLARHRRLGVPRGVARSLKVIADAGLQLGWLEKADRSAEEALGLFRERGFQREVQSALMTLAAIGLRRGQPERARGLCEEALASYFDDGDRSVAAIALTLLGVAAVRLDDLDTAARLLTDGRRVADLDPDRGIIAATLDMLLERGDTEIDLSSADVDA